MRTTSMSRWYWHIEQGSISLFRHTGYICSSYLSVSQMLERIYDRSQVANQASNDIEWVLGMFFLLEIPISQLSAAKNVPTICALSLAAAKILTCITHQAQGCLSDTKAFVCQIIIIWWYCTIPSKQLCQLQNIATILTQSGCMGGRW